jgi:AcrR family transcriptional regulator
MDPICEHKFGFTTRIGLAFRVARKANKIPRKGPSQSRSKATVEAIIEATTRIIEEEGLAALTTNRAAHVAGVSVGSLYQYFPNKDSLIEEVRARFGARFMSGIGELLGRLGALDTRAAIRQCVEVLVALHAESPGVHHALATGSPPETRIAMQAIATSFLDARAAELRRPDRRLAAQILLDATEAIIHTTALREPERLEDRAWIDEVCDMLERYLLRDGARTARSPRRRSVTLRG